MRRLPEGHAPQPPAQSATGGLHGGAGADGERVACPPVASAGLDLSHSSPRELRVARDDSLAPTGRESPALQSRPLVSILRITRPCGLRVARDDSLAPTGRESPALPVASAGLDLSHSSPRGLRVARDDSPAASWRPRLPDHTSRGNPAFILPRLLIDSGVAQSALVAC